MQTQQTIFLDTSIQVHRILLAPQQVHKLEDQIASPSTNMVSSQYVWMEFQRTIVADFAYIHSLMLRYDYWGAIFRHLLDGDRSFRPRSAVRCTKIIGGVYEDSAQELPYARAILAAQVTRGLRNRF